jgi:chromosome segregation ATPase
MSEINQAKEQLQQALAKLDDVVTARSSDGEAQQQEVDEEAKALHAEIEVLRQENAGLKADLVEARNAYVALEEVADAVNNRLDTAIGSIRTVMSH